MRESRKMQDLALMTLLIIITAPLLGDAGSAQTQHSTMDETNAFYQVQNWDAAARGFESITAADPSNALAWLRLGVSRHKLEQFQKAIEAYSHIENHPQFGPSALYREAAAYARMDNKDRALFQLSKAVDAGLADPDMFKQEPDFASIKSDPRFDDVIKKADRMHRPCAYRAENHQFDFWIGEWDVADTQTHSPVGSSTIQLILEQCVVLENWTSLGGGTGKSFNHYDTLQKKWIQDWVDDRGAGIHFEGELKDGVMDYYADASQSNATTIKRHLQFFKLDQNHVRQFSQTSERQDGSWAKDYDFTYTRKQ